MIENFQLSCEVGQAFHWMEWVDAIPYLNLPNNLKIKVIPPFAGAIARFLVTDLEEKTRVSVYLDCYNMLGIMDAPYWEIYPNEDDDASRFHMGEIEELTKAIQESINFQLKEIE